MCKNNKIDEDRQRKESGRVCSLIALVNIVEVKFSNQTEEGNIVRSREGKKLYAGEREGGGG